MLILVGTNRSFIARRIKLFLAHDVSSIESSSIDEKFVDRLYKINPDILFIDIVGLKNRWKKLIETISIAPSIREIPLIVILKKRTPSILKNLCQNEVFDYILESFNKCDLFLKIMKAKKMIELKREFDNLLTKDPLTGAYNRSFLMERLFEEINWCQIYNEPLSLAILDIDYFKKINDTYGHLTGDKVLKDLVHYCMENLPAKVTLGRYGGEEFCLLMPSTDETEAMHICENLRTIIEKKEFFTTKGENVKITVSIGFTSCSNRLDILNSDMILHKADLALYRAKQSGRNRVIYENFMLE